MAAIEPHFEPREITQLFPGAVVESQIVAQATFDIETQAFQEQGRMRRLGRFLVDLPGALNEKIQYAAVSFRNDPAHFTKRAVEITKRPIESMILFAEVTPINEAMRVAAGGTAIAAGVDPVGVGLVYGGATLAIESAAAIAAASWLDSANSKRAIEWFNDKLEKRKISPDAKFSSLTKGGIAFLGGSAIVTAVKHREDPDRTKEQNRRYGLGSAAALAGFCSVQGYLVAQGIETPNPVSIGGATLALSSIIGAIKWGRSRVNREEHEQGIGEI